MQLSIRLWKRCRLILNRLYKMIEGKCIKYDKRNDETMVVICIESSHQRGMGHFYRALNMLTYFKDVNEKAVLVINNDRAAIQILNEKQVLYEIVDYDDVTSNWEKDIIHKYQVDVWLLDKFETGIELAEHVKAEGVILAAIDDCGRGADLIDLHFCAMLFHDLRGKYIYSGKEYMILNPEITKYRRQRTELKKILVTLGGSDTYGVTVKVIKLLKKKGCSADIVTGPDFQNKDLLSQEINSDFVVYETVPSLIAKFYEYDLAITGGGVTCLEANASGLPCIIVANELHEIDNGKYLASFNGAKFAGYHMDISEKDIDIDSINVEKMSTAAMQAIPLNGMDNIYKIIRDYRNDSNAR